MSSSKFKIYKADSPFGRWHLDYPKDSPGGLGETCQTFDAAAQRFMDCVAACTGVGREVHVVGEAGTKR